MQIQIKRIGVDKGHKKVLEVLLLSGNEAAFYDLVTTRHNIKVRQPQILPEKPVVYSRTIPLVYPVSVGPTKQRKSYLMSVPCFADKFKQGAVFKGKKITPDKWIPDIIESEVTRYTSGQEKI